MWGDDSGGNWCMHRKSRSAAKASGQLRGSLMCSLAVCLCHLFSLSACQLCSLKPAPSMWQERGHQEHPVSLERNWIFFPRSKPKMKKKKKSHGKILIGSPWVMCFFPGSISYSGWRAARGDGVAQHRHRH